MTQLGESISIPPVEPPVKEEDDGTKHINLRISLFYDGTKNNRENVQSRQSANKEKNAAYQATRSKKYILFGELDSGDVSYTNDESNISFLEAYLETKEKGNDLHLTVYTEGAGTMNLGGDDLLGAGFGAHKTGIPTKVKKGIAEAKGKIREPNKEVDPTITIIDTLSIDVFGFSRGAATARYAIHLLLKKEAMRIKAEAYSLGYKAITKVEVRLAGLFDTVASFREGLFLGNETWLLDLDAVQHAKKVLHLASADEHRKNFSLTNINSSGNGDQYFLPGVHSDIGGGYTDGEDESLVIFKGTSDEAKVEKQRLIEKTGWYLEGQIETIDYEDFDDMEYEFDDMKFSELRVTRTNLPTAYSIIPLKIMAKFLTNDGIVLNNKYKTKISTIEKINKLKELDKKISADYTKATTPEYWINKNDELKDKWLRDARNQFFHFSAHYSSTGMGPRFDDGKRKRKIYDG